MLSGPRKTQNILTEDFGRLVAAGAVIHQGAMVVLDAGIAEPGKVGTGLKADGIAMKSADNSGGADGDVNVETRRGM
ncbi:MAG: hypothetical protein AAF317_00005, partial [Pseudomonadota bacterium]